MKLSVIEKHEGYGNFPLFVKGTAVSGLKADDEYSVCAEAIWGTDSTPHWLSCVIDGHETFIPDIYVSAGVLIRDYNPTEIIVEKGQTITLIDIVFEWFLVKDENGKDGWIPANKVISIGG
jgi:hypothetical protein